MKQVLAAYYRHAEGIRKYALLAFGSFIIAYILRNLVRPLIFQKVVDALNLHQNDAIRYVIAFGVIILVTQVFFRFGDFMTSLFEACHAVNLRKVALEEFLKHSTSFFANTFSGSLVTKQRRFVSSAEALFDAAVGQYLFAIIQVVGVIAILATISISFMLGFLVWTILYLGSVALVSKKRWDLDVKRARLDSRVTGILTDILSNITLVKMFRGENQERARFHRAIHEQYLITLQTWFYSNWVGVVQGIFSAVIHIGCVGLGVYLWKQGTFTVGNIVLVWIYAQQMSDCLWDLGNSIRRSNAHIAEAKEMTEIQKKSPEIINAPYAIDLQQSPNLPLSIRITDLAFEHRNGTQVFNQLNLYIPAGQKVAIIGTTGAGKTTLVNLLLRFIQPNSGTIHIGPYDICGDITQESMRHLISCVSQRIDLFHLSIRDNIAYGRPTASNEEIYDAAKRARIHDFIMSLPKGYDSMVGEKGVKLSGGQCQRIAIARTLLHDPPVIIFDEATSALDTVTEKEVQEIFETGLKNKTVGIIAHRLSTIQSADRIIALQNGVVVQDGTPAELALDKKGMYAKMLNVHAVKKSREEVVS